jgi:hypothetical protein
MASFGRYQTVRELHRGAYTTVYSAQEEAGSPGQEFCVKVFQPSALLLDKSRAKAETDLFLNRARVQQKVAVRGNCSGRVLRDKQVRPFTSTAH